MQEDRAYAAFQPMYPLLIQQFVDDYGLDEGVAVDIGTGPGSLGLELAKITRMKIRFVDLDSEALNTAENSFKKLGLDNQSEFVKADVRNLPFEDESADFVMSRGSLWFWEEPHLGLREIHRILKKDGVAFIGGGLGRYMPDSMRKRIQAGIKKRLQDTNQTRPNLEEFRQMVERAELSNFQIVTDGEGRGGRWVEIRK